MGSTHYAEGDACYDPFQVEFLDKKSNKRLVRGFPSPYQAEKFINKLKYSKTCTFISYINYC